MGNDSNSSLKVFISTFELIAAVLFPSVHTCYRCEDYLETVVLNSRGLCTVQKT